MARQQRTLQNTASRRPRSQEEKGAKEEFDSKVIQIARVSRVVAGGRRFSFRATVAVGDRAGRVGVGVDKGKDVAAAIQKATVAAKKTIIAVPLAGSTIPRDIQIKYGSARIVLRPAKEGRGVIAGGPVRVVCELAGIRDVSAKILGRSSNRLNNAKAALEALRMLGERMGVRNKIKSQK